LFTVSDTGKGIDPMYLPQLFNRFFKVPTNEQTGTGLGLYIVKGIVEAHGGSIWVDSTLGKGTTVSFTLPCQGQPQST
jgi:signal transduction histidine kinase